MRVGLEFYFVFVFLKSATSVSQASGSFTLKMTKAFVH